MLKKEGVCLRNVYRQVDFDMRLPFDDRRFLYSVMKLAKFCLDQLYVGFFFS